MTFLKMMTQNLKKKNKKKSHININPSKLIMIIKITSNPSLKTIKALLTKTIIREDLTKTITEEVFKTIEEALIKTITEEGFKITKEAIIKTTREDSTTMGLRRISKRNKY